MIIGIDPGLSGAVCALSDCGDLRVFDIDVFERDGGKREVDVLGLRSALRKCFLHPAEPGEAATIVLERASPRPGEGSVSSWRNGCTWGSIYALCLTTEAPLRLVTPQQWKKFLHVPADKDLARKVASELLPRDAHNWPLKKHHNRAEAALIALYGQRVLAVPRRQADD